MINVGLFSGAPKSSVPNANAYKSALTYLHIFFVGFKKYNCSLSLVAKLQR